jgi:hypothetical protein
VKPSSWRTEHAGAEFSPPPAFPDALQWDAQRAVELLWKYLDAHVPSSDELRPDVVESETLAELDKVLATLRDVDPRGRWVPILAGIRRMLAAELTRNRRKAERDLLAHLVAAAGPVREYLDSDGPAEVGECLGLLEATLDTLTAAAPGAGTCGRLECNQCDDPTGTRRYRIAGGEGFSRFDFPSVDGFSRLTIGSHTMSVDDWARLAERLTGGGAR